MSRLKEMLKELLVVRKIIFKDIEKEIYYVVERILNWELKRFEF